MNKILSIYDITLIGLMTASLTVGKLLLTFLPNIEIISLLIILYTLYWQKKVFFAIYAFVLIQGILYGFGLWFIMYLYVWTILAIFTLILQKISESRLAISLLSGFFGLGFGALCTIPYIILSGRNVAFSWWIAGIPSDITHGIGNFILCFILYQPLSALLCRLKQELNLQKHQPHKHNQ